MRRLALRRFPNEVVRRRQRPGTTNFYGEFEPGPVVETIYPARVLPLVFGGFRFCWRCEPA